MQNHLPPQPPHASSQTGKTSNQGVQEANVTQTTHSVLQAIQSGSIHFELTEDEKDDSYFITSQNPCPYQLCDGSGLNYTKVNRRWIPEECKCREELILKRMKKQACIDSEFSNASLEQISAINEFLTLYRLQARKAPLSLDEVASYYGITGKTKNKKLVPLTWDDIPSNKIASIYMDVHYERIRQEKEASTFFNGYTNSVFKRLQKGDKTLNLLLFGDPGAAKTYISISVLTSFLQQGRKAYYIRMKDLVEHPEKIDLYTSAIQSSDFFIFDELGSEYHKENQWALKQVQGFIKIRQEQDRPTIIITNLYPHEWNALYQKKLMSLFNGKFLPIHVTSSIDLRTHFQKQDIQGEDFLS